MRQVRFHQQIRSEGVGRIGFTEDDEDQICSFYLDLPLADIDDKPHTEPKYTTNTRVFIDDAEFDEMTVARWEELDGKTISMVAPDEDDDTHGSHYICACHNPVTVKMAQFRVVDPQHLSIRVSMTIHYDVNGLGDDLELELEGLVAVEV